MQHKITDDYRHVTTIGVRVKYVTPFDAYVSYVTHVKLNVLRKV